MKTIKKFRHCKLEENYCGISYSSSYLNFCVHRKLSMTSSKLSETHSSEVRKNRRSSRLFRGGEANLITSQEICLGRFEELLVRRRLVLASLPISLTIH